MRPVVAYLRAKGHRIFSYLDDFFGAGATAHNDHQATEADTARAKMDIRSMLARLGLNLHPTQCNFVGSQSLEILGIMVGTRRARFLLPPPTLGKVERAARRFFRTRVLTDVMYLQGRCKASPGWKIQHEWQS
jgi:hypothetical protein